MIDDRGVRALLLGLLIGCYSPSPQPGAPCPTGNCPDGLVCSPATQTCEKTAVEIDAARAIVDAAIDARPIDAPPPMATLIQSVTNFALDATTLSATLPAAPKSGNVLVMVGAHISGSITTVSGGGATWTRAASSLINRNVEVWFGVTNGTSSTVTIDRPQLANQLWLAVYEWSGIATTNILDAAVADDGATTTVAPGSITTTNANDLLVLAATAPPPNTYGLPSPGAWTQLTPISNNQVTQFVWYRVVNATGTYGPQVTQSATEWDAAVAALRLAQ